LGEDKLRAKTEWIWVVLMFIPLILIFSCSRQKTEWRGSIEEAEGVTIVKNPKEPMYKKNIFRFEEELCIGEAEGDENYMFSQIGSVAVDDEERIFVADWKESHIKVFDRDGSYLLTIGKKGQGPGEFERVSSIQITEQKELMVFDGNSRRLSFFTPRGELLRSQGTSEIQALNIKMNSEGYFFVSKAMLDPQNFLAVTELDVYDSDLNKITNIARSEPQDVLTPHQPFGVWQLIPNDFIIYGYNLAYEFYIFDPSGKPLKKIIKNYDPVKITDEEKRERLKGMEQPENKETPEFYPAYRKFTVDDENRIFVQTWERPKKGKGYCHDVFDLEGRYIGKVAFEFSPQIWKLGKFYTIEEDEDGFQCVRRYKASWKI
jgi:hypothetical protein